MRPTTPMLLLSANASISDRSKHLSVEELQNLFMSVGSRELSEVEKYIIEAIRSEAHPQEVKNFQARYHIPQERVDTLMSYSPYTHEIQKRLEEVIEGKVEMIHKTLEELESLENA